MPAIGPTASSHKNVRTMERLPLSDEEIGDDTIEGYEPPEAGGWEGYPLDELAIRDERRTAIDVIRRIDKGRFVMDPDFQRAFVWDPKKQSRLIESILLRIPLPTFYVAEDKDGRLIVVDGRQRLTTLQRFLKDELRLVLPDREELKGKKFSELDPRLQNRIEDCQLLFYIIDHTVPERARLDIFERVNGGEVLTRQQMRNAIYNGPATEFLRAEAEKELFTSATGGSLNADKMQDREFVNRFVSFSLLPLETYSGDMDKWLAQGLERFKTLPADEVDRLRERLKRALWGNLSVFGRHSFRKPPREPESDRRSRVNAALFDVMAQQLAAQSEQQITAKADEIRRALSDLLADDRFNRAVTYGPNTPQEVRTRFELANARFAEVFDAE